MRHLLPPRPLVLPRAYHHLIKISTIMAEKNHHNNPKPKRPPLTHFLCLPLVNTVSLPQLESSLTAFRASIPPALPTKSDQNKHQQYQQLIPDDAVRPVGTLHLTLGVMSLSNSERLNEALQFFHSLDLLALLREAEERASHRLTREDGLSTDLALRSSLQDNSAPFTISLESLHALPRARSATVLHASPVDPTSRLYPFCEMLRNKFLEAGLIQPDYQKEQRKLNKKNEPNQLGQEQAPKPPAGEEPTLLEELPLAVAEETAQQPRPPVATTARPQQVSENDKRKLRPLLLHATIANTIYIRGRKRKTSGHGKIHRGNDRYTFDARDILAHYKNFYLDSDRTIRRSSGGVIANDRSKSATNIDESHDAEGHPSVEESDSTVISDDGKSGKGLGYPFVWAKNFPIEAVCICEMGAKKLDPEADERGMNARLGEKYLAIAERSLVSITGK
ncbi:AKAP7 2'5' RNA ligase-like domain-containing protein [Aspergillus spectabilis]